MTKKIPLTSLREARERKGMTQEDLHMLTGVPVQMIADLETGDLDLMNAGVGSVRLLLIELSMSMDKLILEYQDALKNN